MKQNGPSDVNGCTKRWNQKLLLWHWRSFRSAFFCNRSIHKMNVKCHVRKLQVCFRLFFRILFLVYFMHCVFTYSSHSPGWTGCATLTPPCQETSELWWIHSWGWCGKASQGPSADLLRIYGRVWERYERDVHSHIKFTEQLHHFLLKKHEIEF